jgi:hypothetical protein
MEKTRQVGFDFGPYFAELREQKMRAILRYYETRPIDSLKLSILGVFTRRERRFYELRLWFVVRWAVLMGRGLYAR